MALRVVRATNGLPHEKLQFCAVLKIAANHGTKEQRILCYKDVFCWGEHFSRLPASLITQFQFWLAHWLVLHDGARTPECVTPHRILHNEIWRQCLLSNSSAALITKQRCEKCLHAIICVTVKTSLSNTVYTMSVEQAVVTKEPHVVTLDVTMCQLNLLVYSP